MITIKNKASIKKMEEAGRLLAGIFERLSDSIVQGKTTKDLDSFIEQELKLCNLRSMSKGYKGYKHVSCISVNDEVVHGVPRDTCVLKNGDLVKVDVCASWDGYCADMARAYVVGGNPSGELASFIHAAQAALDKGIAQARPGNRLSDISAAIQKEIESHGYGIVRDFAGHGIGKNMHEEPEIVNYGTPGRGPLLQPGMAFALEPMITMGNHTIYIMPDGWTVKTKDKSMAMHVEDTIVITQSEPMIITRTNTIKVGA